MCFKGCVSTNTVSFLRVFRERKDKERHWHFRDWTQEKNLQGGLAARSGTEFTWLPQLRNSAEWDWVPIFLKNKYGGECRRGRTMSFCSVLSFPAYKYQEKVSMNFFNGPFRHQEAWCINSSWVTSLIVIRDLGKFSQGASVVKLSPVGN